MEHASSDPLPDVFRGLNAVFSRPVPVPENDARSHASADILSGQNLSPQNSRNDGKTQQLQCASQVQADIENLRDSRCMNPHKTQGTSGRLESSQREDIPVLVDFRSVLPGGAFASISSSFRPTGPGNVVTQRLSRSSQEERGSSRVRGSASSSSSSSSSSSTATSTGASTATASPEAPLRASAVPSQGTGSLELLPNLWRPLQQVAFPFLVEGGAVATTLVVTMSAAALGALQPGRLSGNLLAQVRGALVELQERRQQNVDRIQKLLPVGLLLKAKWKRPHRRRLENQAWGPRLLASIVHTAPFSLFPPTRIASLPGTSQPKSGEETGSSQPKVLSGVEAFPSSSEPSTCPSARTGATTAAAPTRVAVSVDEPSRKELALASAKEAPPPGFSEPPESTRQLAVQIAASAEVSWSGFIRPVDKVWEISSRFGPRWGRNHNGVDLAAPTGEPVLAADEGKVTYSGWEPTGFGYLIEITHDDGWRTLYGHNSKLYAWTGKRVRRGECIALVGETGRATGPHLHWEIRKKDGFPVDPAKYVPL